MRNEGVRQPPREPSPTDFGVPAEGVKSYTDPPLFTLLWAAHFFLFPGAVAFLFGEQLKALNEVSVFLTMAVTLGPWIGGIVALFKAEERIKRWARARLPHNGRFEEYLAACRRYEAARAEYDEWLRTQVGWWQSLDGYGFERELCSVLSRSGYSASRTGGPGDEGVDLVVTFRTQSGSARRAVVQAKAHAQPVGVGAVRDLLGTLVHHRADEAWLVATNGFTAGAETFASNKPIALATIDEILAGRFPGPSRCPNASTSNSAR